MDKIMFRELFVKNINKAILNIESMSSKPIPRNFEVELHGAGVSGALFTIDEAVDRIYISDNLFYLVIDVGVKTVSDEICRLFVRISDHDPASFDRTWNSPLGNGPFKVLLTSPK